MTDETFERFRRKLADVVTVAINSGARCSESEGRCPLGCHPRSTGINPFPRYAATTWGINWDDAFEFIQGFDDNAGTGPYAELGRLYRARFP